MTTEANAEDSIARRLIAVLDPESDKVEDVLSALIQVFTFHMSLTCPNCRKNIARKLRREVPQMLAEANAFAAMAGPREDKHLQ